MFQIKDWLNPEEVEYFDLIEFVENIKLNYTTLSIASETEDIFSDYIKHLAIIYQYDLEKLIFSWLDQGIREQVFSNEIENHRILFQDMATANLFFEKLSIGHERIKKIHRFVCENGATHSAIVGDYRKTPVFVGVNNPEEKLVYWNGVKVEDIKPFMDRFIQFYKTNTIKEIYNNPFLKGALVHLLFVRIHPFGDGNGRTARILQNIAFTNGINNIYGTKLKLSPLNISQCIAETKMEYVDIINRVHFNLDYDNTEILNKWFQYMLYKYQEQINYQSNRFGEIDVNLEAYLKSASKSIGDSVEEMKVRKLIK